MQNSLIAIAVIYGVYQLSKGLTRMDKAVDIATKPAGKLLSDFGAIVSGYQPVELTDLIIQPWYVDSNYRISDDAWDVLTRDEDYKKILLQMTDNQVIKAEYQHLIGQKIGAL